jgi:hypothetical protein
MATKRIRSTAASRAKARIAARRAQDAMQWGEPIKPLPPVQPAPAAALVAKAAAMAKQALADRARGYSGCLSPGRI